jgi:hypothetical protein
VRQIGIGADASHLLALAKACLERGGKLQRETESHDRIEVRAAYCSCGVDGQADSETPSTATCHSPTWALVVTLHISGPQPRKANR